MVSILIWVITVGLLAMIGILPIVFALRQPDFYRSFTFSVLSVAALTVILPWWRDFALDLELIAMGVDLEGFTTEDRMRNVAEPDRERAEAKVFAPERLGIGWPLRAAFAVFVTIPYAVVICAVICAGRGILRRYRSA